MKQKSEANKIAVGFFELLKKRKQTDLLPEILRCLADLGQNFQTRVVVESAYSLGTSDQKKVLAMLKKNFKVVEATFEVDSKLIGGIRVRFGDNILDLSLKQKMDELISSTTQQ